MGLIQGLEADNFFGFRENREMRAAQARASVEVAKEVNNDKSLKSRDKERLLKEKQANQTKVMTN